MQTAREKIRELRALHEDGLLSLQEFDSRKNAILDAEYAASAPGRPARTHITEPGEPAPGRSATRPPTAPPVRKGTELGLMGGQEIGPQNRRYRLERLIALGGMGQVWQATDLATHAELGSSEMVALKILPPELTQSATHAKLLVEEATQARKLAHQHIVRVYEWAQDPATSSYFIIMECLEGEDLDTHLAKHGPLAYDRVQQLLRPVADALDYAWEKHRLVHRDIKPANVFLTRQGEVKLLDFGIAMRVRNAGSSLGIQTPNAGTEGYRAPEAGVHQRQPNPRTDVYAVSVMIYQMLEGKLPFEHARSAGQPLPSAPAALNAAQWQVLQNGFSMKVELRPASVMALLEALERATGPSEEELAEQTRQQQLAREEEARRQREEAAAREARAEQERLLEIKRQEELALRRKAEERAAAVEQQRLAVLRREEAARRRVEEEAARKARKETLRQQLHQRREADAAKAQLEQQQKMQLQLQQRLQQQALEARQKQAAEQARQEEYKRALAASEAAARRAQAQAQEAAPAPAPAPKPDDMEQRTDEEVRELPAPAPVLANIVTGADGLLRDAYLDGSGEGPDLVLLQAGRFQMGAQEHEHRIALAAGSQKNWLKRETPAHWVGIERPFALGRYPVTVGQWRKFVNASGWEVGGDVDWDKPGFVQNDRHPVVGVSWFDAQQYIRWLSEKTGRQYRLPTEAEWEYACRAGSKTAFSVGDTITTEQANFDGNYTYNGGPAGQYRGGTTPCDMFAPNAWGLHDMHGNVWEWVQDAVHENYEGAPVDGSAWEEGGDKTRRILRGGSWLYNPRYLRSAVRNGYSAMLSNDIVGFRVARTLE
jgi:formylglycine-generating enzyme required for sulfatase activity